MDSAYKIRSADKNFNRTLQELHVATALEANCNELDRRRELRYTYNPNGTRVAGLGKSYSDDLLEEDEDTPQKVYSNWFFFKVWLQDPKLSII